MKLERQAHFQTKTVRWVLCFQNISCSVKTGEGGAVMTPLGNGPGAGMGKEVPSGDCQ